MTVVVRVEDVCDVLGIDLSGNCAVVIKAVELEEVEVLDYQDAFLALSLTPGSHRVELTFVPTGMGIGVIISALGAIFSVALIVITRRKQPDCMEEEIKLDREEDS